MQMEYVWQLNCPYNPNFHVTGQPSPALAALIAVHWRDREGTERPEERPVIVT